MIGDERRAIEHLLVLDADAIGGRHWRHVRDGMTQHRPAPARSSIETVVMRLRPDRRRVQKYVRAHQRHGARGFRVPLVPADPDADPALLRVPHAEAGIAGAEIVFLLIARPVGNVRLAIDAHQRSIGVDHHDGVEVSRPRLLEDRDRDHHAQFLGQLRHRDHSRALAPGMRAIEIVLFLRCAEIVPLEQFRRQDHVSALGRGFAHQLADALDVRFSVVGQRTLQDGQRDLAGHVRLLFPVWAIPAVAA